METTVCSQSPSSNTVITNYVRNAQSISNDSIGTSVAINEEVIPDFEQSAIRLLSTVQDLKRALLKPRHLREDRYSCLFQQSECVETQGESFGAGHETCVIACNVNADENENSQGFLLTLACTIGFRTTGVSFVYADLGDYDQRCHHYGAAFLFGERLKGDSNSRRPKYHICYGGGKIYREPTLDPSEYIKHLLLNKHFMENIRAYNQMFAMTSVGAKINESINNGRGLYIFKVSGQMYHWIGLMCPLPGESPRFLQQYIYDTEHELENRMWHFSGLDNSDLDLEIVQEIDVHEFKIRLYNGDGARGYELPASITVGAIVYDSGLAGSTKFDVVIKHIGGLPKRINKLHKSYMSLQFPLLFNYGQPGFYTELKLRKADDSGRERRRGEAVSTIPGLYDAISRGERDGFEVGGRIILLMSFTGGLVEFQKRGLPHCHTLLWVDSASKIQEPEDVDRLISAELPDPQTDPEGYKDHINVEYCGWSMLIKYLFKYISKGMDIIFSRVSRPLGESSNLVGSSRPPIDEIQNNLAVVLPMSTTRSNKVIWRILKFDIHCREPAVQMLYVYLEDMQRITFRDRDRLEYVVNLPGRKSTTLTKWFAYNAANEDGMHLTYLDFPSDFVWYDDRKSWSPRQSSKSTVGHLAYVHPTSEACASATSSQLKFVFARILTHYEVTDPLNLWTKYWQEMSHDILGKVSKMDNIPNYHLRPPPPGLLDMLAKRLLIEERNHNEKELQQQKDESVPKLNAAQRKELVRLSYGRPSLVPCALKKIVLVVASFGIASLLPPLSRTAHFRFKLAIELTEESLCKVTKNSHLGNLLADTDLIIYDVAPMNEKSCFEALDRSLGDILTMPHRLFRVNSIFLGGDFRKTLPMKKGDFVPLLPAMLAGATVDQAPHPEGNTSGSAEDSIQLKELMVIVPRLVTRIETLETELQQTKTTYGKAVLTLVKRGEEPEDQGRIIQDIDDDPLVSLVRESMKIKEKSTDFVTPTKASGEAQEEDISPTILEAAKTLRRARSVAKNINNGLDAEEEINTKRVEINTGIEEVSTGSAKVDSGTASKRGQREGKAPIVEEDIQATHKTKEQIRQEEAGLMVDMVNQRKKHFAEERAKAKRNKSMTQSQLRIYMSNYLKNQGTWKLSQLKKL
ncbi:DNA helicase [Tanacetum coccineum]|uniref:ATP-dependent DNA helicase n=1 Tax=Tanacetum coccineum TaxID=301880 RepID=A0ABQ5GKG1_9ASTR